MIRTLIEIGKINTFFPETKEWLPSLQEQVKSEVKNFEEEFKDFSAEIKNYCNFLNSEDLLENSLSIEEEIEEALLGLNEVGFLTVALKTEKNLILTLPEGKQKYQKLNSFTNKLYQWFYENFEPYRLVVFNELRRRLIGDFKEWYYIEGIFPWLDLYVEEDPEILSTFAKYIAFNPYRAIPSEFSLAYFFVFEKKDPVLLKYFGKELAFWKAVKSLQEKKELMFSLVVQEADFALLSRMEGEDPLAEVYPTSAVAALQKMCQENPQEALVLALTAGPLGKKRPELVKKFWNLLKKEKLTSKLIEALEKGDLDFAQKEAERLIVLWKFKCEEFLKISASKTEEEYFKEFEKIVEETGKSFKETKLLQPEELVNLYYLTIKLLLEKQRSFKIPYLGEDQEERSVDSFFSFKIPAKKDTSFQLLPNPDDEFEIVKGNREGYNTLYNNLFEFVYFLWFEGKKYPEEIEEASEVEEIQVEPDIIKKESFKATVFISFERKILENLRNAIIKGNEEEIKKLAESGKIVVIEVILKNKEE